MSPKIDPQVSAALVPSTQLHHKIQLTLYHTTLPSTPPMSGLLRIHPILHTWQLKPVFLSPLSPQEPTPRLPGTLTVVLPTPSGASLTYNPMDVNRPEERSWIPGHIILDPTFIQDYRCWVFSQPDPSGDDPGAGGTVTRTSLLEQEVSCAIAI